MPETSIHKNRNFIRYIQSGFPGSSDFSRYRNPLCQSAFLSSNSGFVLLPRTEDMHLRLCSGVRTSGIAAGYCLSRSLTIRILLTRYAKALLQIFRQPAVHVMSSIDQAKEIAILYQKTPDCYPIVLVVLAFYQIPAGVRKHSI